MERFLSAVPEARDRELLRLRYIEGLTVPQLQHALAAQGIYYGQRHVERLLAAAEKAAEERWPGWAQEEVQHERQSR